MARLSEDDTVRDNSEENGPQPSDEKGDGGENGKSKEGDKSPVGFWHSDLNSTRKSVIKNWALTTLILCVAVIAILSLYWAVLFRVEENLSSLVVWVVDFDAQVAPYSSTVPLVGPAVIKAAEMLVAPSGSLGWEAMPASYFNNDPLEVRRQVYNQKAWAAIIINSNATALLQEAVQTGNASYDPNGALQLVYVESRDAMTFLTYAMPQISLFEQQVPAMFGKMWAAQVATMASTHQSIISNLEKAPQAISPAIGFSIFNLRPFNPPTETPSQTIGLIYLIIIAFFSFTFYLPHHLKFVSSPGHRPLKFWQLILWRWISTILAYLFLSLAYSIISLAFQIPFSDPPASDVAVVQPTTAFHYASFVVFWMLNFVGMIALGLACENVAMFIGQPWTALWLIFWVISNVSTSLYPIELAPHFYYWGYAWPLHNIVEGTRTILFDLHSRLGLNFGILFAWVAVNTALFPLACMFQGKQQKKEKENKK